MNPQLQQQLTQDIETITQSLKNTLSPAPHVLPAEKWLIDAMKYSCLNGGKRIRPFLVLETARLLGATEKHPYWNGIVDCALALEMIHCYSLGA